VFLLTRWLAWSERIILCCGDNQAEEEEEEDDNIILYTGNHKKDHLSFLLDGDDGKGIQKDGRRRRRPFFREKGEELFVRCERKTLPEANPAKCPKRTQNMRGRHIHSCRVTCRPLSTNLSSDRAELL
jgi:hypothetical protein